MFTIKRISFLKYRKIYYIVFSSLIILGLAAGFIRGFNYGIDFTGGTMLQLEMGREVSVSEIDRVLKTNDIEADIVHAGEMNSQVIIRTVQALDTAAREELLSDLLTEFNLPDDAVMTIEQFGPSVGDMLKKNAVKAVIIASLGILIYIIVRFEWKFGLAAIISVIHDVLILIAFYGFFGISINNPFIAAVLTLVGYSVNDTVVVFDRIRENLNIMKKNKLEELVDTSINQTLVRSLMTSVTIIVAIIPLFILGGDIIRQFTLPLVVGIAAGALSSICIASPIYYELCQLTGGPKYKAKKSRKNKE
ncbi:MAG: protein translocase subunit SecF [Eubacteriales bacterium]|nr:protein translocase subunit SecF [Eubacteriales bacterium]